MKKSIRCVDAHIEDITREAASRGYDIHFIELVELVYGKGFLSQGGPQSVKHMVGDLDLTGLRVLDIGSGLGGPCIHLAQQYAADIVGIEPQDWMVDQAKKNLDAEKEVVKGSVDFIVMESTSHLQMFSDNSFDVILSKEVLLHVPLQAKPQFFSEIYRVLKPGGRIILMDWLHTTTIYSEKTKTLMELDGVAYNLLTLEEYLTVLDQAGFSGITWEDTTKESCMTSQDNVDTLVAYKDVITTKYDKETFKASLESWNLQKSAFASKELATGIFRGTKY